MGFYGQAGNSNPNGNNGLNGQNAAFNNAAFANGIQGQQPHQRQLNAAQMALLAQQQRQNGMQQALQQQQRPMQNPATLNPQLVQQLFVQQQQRAQQTTPSQAARPPVPQGQPAPRRPQLEEALAAIAPRLPIPIQQRIASGTLTTAEQQGIVSQYVQAQTRERLAQQARSSPQPGQVRPAAQTQQSMPNIQTPAQGAQRPQQPSQLQGRPVFPHALSSPTTSTKTPPPRGQTPPPASVHHPTVLSTPPQAPAATRMTSPPRAESRRGSTGIVPQGYNSSSIDNPALAAAIPSVTPSTFQLDQSRLRLPHRAQQANANAPSGSAPVSLPTTPGNEPSYGSSVLLPTQRKRPPQAPSVAFLPTAPRERSPVRDRGDGGERRRGNEGMRGSMRNERESLCQRLQLRLTSVAKLMWAAGDEPEPDTNAVDYMEDLVVDFLADLCRPIPPMRSNPGAPRQPVPLSTGIVRDRLATKPAYKKYLARFDTMAYLEGEIKKSRKSFANPETNFDDIIDTVGKDYLEIDVVGPAQSQPGAPKRKGRPTKKALLADGTSAVKTEGMPAGSQQGGGEGDDAPSARRKPGPKKGWKRTLPVSVDGEAPQPQQAMYGSDGRKIKRPNKKRKKEEGGLEAHGASPATR